MAAIKMDGKALAAKVKEEVGAQVAGMEQKPGLAVVLVGIYIPAGKPAGRYSHGAADAPADNGTVGDKR